MKYNWAKVPSVPAIFKILKTRIKFDNEELSKLFFDNLEDFFYYGTIQGYITNNNYKSVLAHLLNIKRVGKLMPVFNDKKSTTLSDKTGIFLADNLNQAESKYFMLKEIIRNASSISPKITRTITKEHLMSKGVYGEEKDREDIYFEDGFRLLEEGIIIDMTENIYYASKSKKRPFRSTKHEKNIFGRSTKFLSNFRYHPSFQEISTMVLRGIVKNNESLSDDQVLKCFGRSSLFDNFSHKLFMGMSKTYGDDVYDVIGKLGIIYKKETDEYNQNLLKNDLLRVVHAKRAYRDIMKYIPEEEISRKAC